jgi:hypothetical protein
VKLGWFWYVLTEAACLASGLTKEIAMERAA